VIFLGKEILFGIIAIPFVIMIIIPTIIAILYLIYLILSTVKYRTKLGLKELSDLFLEDATAIPGYEPAIMAYLVNYQKIGKREICSTLFDLIGRNVIKITLKSGFVSDEKSKYMLELNEDSVENLSGFETELIKYIFRSGKKIKSETLHKRFYKKNLNKNFYDKFLKLIQDKAKTFDFFDKKTAKRKITVYKIINKVVTILASVSSFLVSLALGVDDMDEVLFSIVVFSLITALILWALKFLISLMYNLNCFYNDFSENGNADYKKWMGFRKYLKNYSTIPDHPLMGVMVWERYYAYAIGLKCSKKFYKQMKAMKIVDNSVDVKLFETLNDIVNCIGASAKKIKSISIDEYGGSHVDY